MMRRPVCAMITGFVLTSSVTVGSAQAPAPSAARDGAPAADEQSLAELKKRALAYWEARVKRDYRAEYDLMEPRAQARISADDYGRGRNVQYLAAQVEGAERRGNFARVTVRVLIRVVAPLAGTRIDPRTDATSFQDHWALIGGTWYRTADADLRDMAPWPAARE